MIISKATQKDLSDNLDLQYKAYESEENIRLYKKNGYIEYKIKKLNDQISLVFLQKRVEISTF